MRPCQGEGTKGRAEVPVVAGWGNDRRPRGGGKTVVVTERFRLHTGYSLLSAVLGSLLLKAEAYGVPIRLQSAVDNRLCLVCHAKSTLTKRLPTGKVVSLYVNEADYQRSVHAERLCTDCHVDIVELPHEKEIELVNCSRCHYVGTVSPPDLKKYAEYRESIHKVALDRGNHRAPACQDCHGYHNILPPTDPDSQINRRNIPQTCGKCHLAIYSDYQEGIHGRLLRAGNSDVPVCTDCHGEHNIQSPQDPNSRVYATQVPQTCASCHAAEKIMRKYGIKVDKYETYRESYHGVVNQYGGITVANCASCHQAHRILPASDPASSVNKHNLPRTCGQCHPGANANFARGKMHVRVTKEEARLLYYVRLGFRMLTIGVMAALIGHIFLDLFSRWRERRRGRRRQG